MRVDTILSTSGRGLWSNVAKDVRVIGLDLAYVDDETNDYGHLNVKFDSRQWNVNRLGLIYTDPKFMRELRAFLTSIGLPGHGVDYTEQGMQGDNYVSCCVGKRFINAWRRMHGV